MINPKEVLELINSKKVPASIRIALNLIFSASISSNIFEKCFFKYHIINLSNYKAIIDYFLNGSFFIPLFLFLSTFYVVNFLCTSIFAIVNILIAENIRFKIDQFMKTIDMADFIGFINDEISERYTHADKKSFWIKFFLYARNEFTKKDIAKMRINAETLKTVNLNHFFLFTNGIICSTIYFCKQDYYPWWLYLITCLIYVVSTLLFTFSYQFYELVPYYASRFLHFIDKQIPIMKTELDKKLP